jgi:hypothetical protein
LHGLHPNEKIDLVFSKLNRTHHLKAIQNVKS